MRRSRIAVASCCAGLCTLVLLPLLSGCPTGTGGGSPVLGFNLPPTVVLSADITRGIAPLRVQFNSSNSTDDGVIVRRVWDFDDGQTSQEIAPSHTFAGTGEFNVTLTLTDDLGDSTTRSVSIAVTLAPNARLIVDRTSAASAPAVFNFDASSSTDPDGEIVRFSWDFGDASGDLEPIVPHTYGRPGTYRVRLTVTDNTGVTATDDEIIEVGIPRPTISFRSPPAEVTNVVATNESPLWVHTVFDVLPNTPATVRAGVDRDRDACDANATVFSAEDGSQELMLTGHDEPVTAVAFSPDDSRLATASDDRTVKIYSTASALELQTMGGHTGGINALAFSPDGTRIVTGGDDDVAIIHAVSNAATLRTLPAQADVASVAYSPDGDAVVIGVDLVNDPDQPAETQPLVALFDAATGDELMTYLGHTARVSSVAFTPDGNRILTGSVNRSARLWDRATGVELMTFVGHTNSVTSVAFFVDGADELVLTGSSDFTARLWDVATGEELRTFDGHTDRVTSVAFSDDGTQIITGSGDGTVRMWNRATAAQVRSLSSCTSAVSSIALSSDGSRIAAGIEARNSIQLDSLDRPSGNDVNLQVPTPLSLAGVPDGARYFLWAEIDTDRTTPVRIYSQTVVNVIAPFTSVIEDETPFVVYDSNNSAAIAAVPSARRQIVALGGLEAGDRIHLSLLSLPGYGRYFEQTTPYSVLILDDSTDPDDPNTLQPEMLAWYQDSFVKFDRNTRLTVAHDATYYLVLDGVTGQSLAPSVHVRIESGFGDTPRRQQVFVNFAGADAVSVADLPPFDVPTLDAADVRAGWGAAETTILKAAIMQTLAELYVNADGDAFAIDFISSDDDPSPGPVSKTVYFGGDSVGGLFALGIADYIDPRNDAQAGNAVIFTNGFGDAFSGLTPDQVGTLIGVVAAHEIGHLLGLRHVDNDDDVMAAIALDAAQRFERSPITANEQYNAQIGFQNAPRYLEEVLGLMP